MPRLKKLILRRAWVGLVPLALLLVHGLAACATDRPMPNVAVRTIGGKQLWADTGHRGGWRIQQHVWTGHARLLDPNDVRRTWGSKRACEQALDQLVPTGDAEKPIVVLLHGLWRTRASMSVLRDAFRDEGYEVLDVSYPSTRRSIDEHAAQLAGVLDGLEGNGRCVSFVTHSLGALVLRRALAREGDPWRERQRLGRAVLIAAPNRGSALARVGARIPGALVLYGEPSREIAHGAARDDASLPLPFVTIAGARGTAEGWNPFVPGDDDGVVGVAETRLEGAVASWAVPAIHTFIIRDAKVVDAAIRFVAEGAVVAR